MTKSVLTLDDKYTRPEGRVFMSSNQALVRLPLDQARRDRQEGLKTAGYISGYRGSPLGVYDAALWSAQKLLDEHAVRFAPGLNEELAVSAIRGTQQLAWFGKSDYRGVFGLWYGKGIGVDRACEALKLGNFEGTSARGGFLAVAGDDHGGKSSDSAHQSEQTLMAAMLPVLYPATIGEIIEFGLFGWQMSRFSGAYVGLKCVTDTLDISGVVDLPDPYRTYVVPEDVEVPSQGLNLVPRQPPTMDEIVLVDYRLPAATAFARANGIDRTVIDGARRTLSIVTAGKVYLDVRQALHDLGLDEPTCEQLGIRLYKPGLIWPMDGENLKAFAEGSQAVLVVEEKRPVMEDQVARHLYSVPADRRPDLTGKRDLQGAPLLSAIGELSVPAIRHAIRTVLDQLGIADERVSARYSHYREVEARNTELGSSVIRPAYFCSGCPHNTSSRLPEGSQALGGIGCHGLVAVVMDRNTMQFLPMGHEGTNWHSVAPLVDTKHMFANMGDGTYSHSGVLAIRGSVAAGANITYKLLYNDAVAMTGGQPVEQNISPVDMVKQLLSEGVKEVRLVSDYPDQYDGQTLPARSRVQHRDEMDAIQRELRETDGVTAIVYEQTCATEKRRRRKRGLMEDPDRRVFINPEVCEGCGDCSVQSNCISVEPLETALGRKRKINQSTCNKDFSCLKGFCPSFVTVEGAKIAVKASGNDGGLQQLIESLPEPQVVRMGEDGYSILVGGVGGTGVLTIGALLGMAAHLDGKGSTILDMTGMAQKGGAVTSHIRFGPAPDAIYTSRLSEGMTDLLLGCDMIVSAGAAVLKTLKPGKTTVVLNNDVSPTGQFQSDRNFVLDEAKLRREVEKALDGGTLLDVPASTLALNLTGDSIGTNVLMMGYAAQKGLLPVSPTSIREAIRLNGTFVEGNLRTFDLGRLAAHDPEALVQYLKRDETGIPEALDDVVDSRMALLQAYQGAKYANAYKDFVDHIRQTVADRGIDADGAFVKAVALSLSRLMAYKDEYEVARLYTEPKFMERIRAQFSGDLRMTFHLAPPLLPGKDGSGRPRKRAFGPWTLKLFKFLAALKVLRGTPFDLFGYTAERQKERALIRHYRELIEDILPDLSAANLADGIALAEAALEIRGFGPVKEAAIAAYEQNLTRLRAAYDGAVSQKRSGAAWDGRWRT